MSHTLVMILIGLDSDDWFDVAGFHLYWLGFGYNDRYRGSE